MVIEEGGGNTRYLKFRRMGVVMVAVFSIRRLRSKNGIVLRGWTLGVIVPTSAGVGVCVSACLSVRLSDNYINPFSKYKDK